VEVCKDKFEEECVDETKQSVHSWIKAQEDGMHKSKLEVCTNKMQNG
jgi:hypothetical protein